MHWTGYYVVFDPELGQADQLLEDIAHTGRNGCKTADMQPDSGTSSTMPDLDTSSTMSLKTALQFPNLDTSNST